MKTRRDFLKILGIGFFSSTLYTILKTFFPKSNSSGKKGERIFKYVKGEKKGKPLRVTDFRVGEAKKVYFQGNLAIVIRLEEEKIKDKNGTQSGFVAYSGICTHLCCVPFWDKNLDAIFCPCHDGMYSPYESGKVLQGPPPRPLPKIPVKIRDDGIILGEMPKEKLGC
ncbi:MAG: ubiquinol-cytochrome c reductase iron-sulfur subunit [Candidatus Methanofastidiosia archaeon]